MTTTKVDKYRLLLPGQYPILESIEIRQLLSDNRDFPQLIVNLAMCSKDSIDTRRLRLSFSGVTELSLRPFVVPVQFTALSIDSIEDWQWQHAKYKVANREQDTELGFYCVDFTAEVA